MLPRRLLRALGSDLKVVVYGLLSGEVIGSNTLRCISEGCGISLRFEMKQCSNSNDIALELQRHILREKPMRLLTFELGSFLGVPITRIIVCWIYFEASYLWKGPSMGYIGIVLGGQNDSTILSSY